MKAAAIGGYRLKLSDWEIPAVLAQKTEGKWDDDRVTLVMPDMTIDNRPYVVSLDVSLYSARGTVRALNRAIKLLDPPKPRVKRG